MLVPSSIVSLTMSFSPNCISAKDSRPLPPDVDRAIGGVKQLYRHVEHLVALGWDAAVVTEAEGFRPSGLPRLLPVSPRAKSFIWRDVRGKYHSCASGNLPGC